MKNYVKPEDLKKVFFMGDLRAQSLLDLDLDVVDVTSADINTSRMA